MTRAHAQQIFRKMKAQRRLKHYKPAAYARLPVTRKPVHPANRTRPGLPAFRRSFWARPATHNRRNLRKLGLNPNVFRFKH